MTALAKEVSAKKVAKYFLLPGILPRARELGGSGFGYLAFLIAMVYNAVRILPSTHPYTNPANIGTFGLRQVVGAAANHVVMDRKNIDQIVVFFGILAGLVILVLQFVLLLLMLLSGEAFAAGAVDAAAGFEGIFKTRTPEDDIAFMLLDHVFGIPDFFGSSVATGTPFHVALQALFEFYNLAILIVAVLVFLYYVVVVVAETAQTGTPFGQRFSHIYAPLRLVVAMGLLVPINYGFNASQYITLVAARLGSGMASNGWIVFNRATENPIGQKNASLIASPQIPDADGLAEFFTVVQTCRESYKIMRGMDGVGSNGEIKAYIVIGKEALDFIETDVLTIRQKLKNGDIEVVFGEKADMHSTFAGNVRPYCGKLNIPFSATNPETLSNKSGKVDAGYSASLGPEYIQEMYYRLAQFGYTIIFSKYLGERMAHANHPHHSRANPCIHVDLFHDEETCKTTYKPPSPVKQEMKQLFNTVYKTGIQSVLDKTREAADFTMPEDILKRGWGGAGIWYNKIADANGAMTAAIKGIPTPSKYPELMEAVKTAQAKQGGTNKPCQKFRPNLGDGKNVDFDAQGVDMTVLGPMNAAYEYWTCDPALETGKGSTGNIIWDAMHIIFGSNGLFDLRKNNADEVHPLAALVAIGKSLVDSSIRNMAFSMGTAVFGGFGTAIESHWGASLQAASEMFTSIALIGLIAGFILYYILPFLPFIYFFFAVGAWVKTIFEAMVGAPLWALAHLRIDGDGLPGKSAANGYLLIFEIFVRPILTVFGLIGGMAIFTAMAVILHDLFAFVVYNITGTAMDMGSGTDMLGVSAGGTGGTVDDGLTEFRRYIVDEFFFTIVYAVVMYMMALASFKMIDLVPQQVLRWIGDAVSTFADQSGDPKEGLVKYAAVGGYTVGGQVMGAVNTGLKGTGQAAGALAMLGQKSQAKP
ncbi:MAG: DotA/TraY family protein [Rhodospirillales bacterium]|nr:MAG: DotA/TraY family protein [Rhodospirillales bacterium]